VAQAISASKHWFRVRWRTVLIIVLFVLVLAVGLHELGVWTPLETPIENVHMRIGSWIAEFRWTPSLAIGDNWRWT